MIQWIAHDERFERLKPSCSWSAWWPPFHSLRSVDSWVGGGSGFHTLFFMRQLLQCGSLWWPALQLSDGERARIYMLSLIPRSCQLDSCERIRMSSVWKWCWASEACCMMTLIGAWKNILNSLPELHVQTLRRNLPHMVCYQCWLTRDNRQCRYCRDSRFGRWGGQDGLSDCIVVEMPFCCKQQ